jgi:hypothetical protein
MPVPAPANAISGVADDRAGARQQDAVAAHGQAALWVTMPPLLTEMPVALLPPRMV